MKIVRPHFEILTDITCSLAVKETGIPGVDYAESEYGAYELKQLEKIARTCYKSEDKITASTDSAKKLIGNLIKNGHEAMLEHGYLTVKFICDRAISHEIVRHRMASFAQESQRYCNYSKDKFDGHVTFVQPWWMDDSDVGYPIWKNSCLQAEKAYFDLLDEGYSPQQARMVLPNCTKTEIIVTANYREWRHILKLRTAPDAHPDMRALMLELLRTLHFQLPVIFDDIHLEEVKL